MEGLSETIMASVDHFAPEKPWIGRIKSDDCITNKVKNAINKRNQLFQLWVKQPTELNRINYKTSRNRVTRMIRSEKKKANYKKLGVNPTAKTIYKTIKTTQKQQDVMNFPNLNVLNNYFVSIGPKLSSNFDTMTEKCNIPDFEKTMFVHPTNEKEISEILRGLKNKKSSGHDGISNEILKCCSPIIEPFLVKIFNQCIENCIFPDCFKIAKVIPLYKKGDKKDPQNYRPISLLSSLSKIFEKIIHKQMMNFCRTNKLLNPRQYGFRDKMSCTDAIAAITDFIRNAIDKKLTGQVCYIDLQKAFDTLDHKILLNKMEKLGLRGNINHLIGSYLTNRWQYIKANSMSTEKLKLCTGVPQGSVLGPFLFLLYINDLPNVCQNSQMMIFADDTTIINAGKRTDPLIKNDIVAVSKWFKSSKLTINTDKCEAMFFGCGKPDNLNILSNILGNQNSCKYLVVHIDKTLKFREHIDHVVKKLNKFCGLMYRVRHLYPRKCLLMFYNSYAKSVITYGLLLYGTAAKSNLSKIETVQRRILRAIYFKRKSDSLENVLADNKILTVFELFMVEILKELFRQLKSESPRILLQINQNSDPKFQTRWNKRNLYTPTYSRTVTNSKSLTNCLQKAYNWLKNLDLVPSSPWKMSPRQLKQYISKITSLYIVDNKQLLELFYN